MPQTSYIPIFQSFVWDQNDPLAAEHALVSRLLTEVLARDANPFDEIDFEATEAGRIFFAAKPEALASLLLALVARASQLDGQSPRYAEAPENSPEQLNRQSHWAQIAPVRHVTDQALRRLLRRKLPLQSEHLLKLAEWMVATELPNEWRHPLKGFVKALETYGPVAPADTALTAALGRLIAALRKCHIKSSPKLALQIEQRLQPAGDSASSAEAELPPADGKDEQPAPLGDPAVLSQLKQLLGMSAADTPAPSEITGFDQFPLRADSPLRAEHELINRLLPELVERPGYHDFELPATVVGKQMLGLDSVGKTRIVRALAERCVNTYFATNAMADHRRWQSHSVVTGAFRQLVQDHSVTPDRTGLFEVLLYLSALDYYAHLTNIDAIARFLGQVESFAAAGAFTPAERHVLHRLRCQAVRTAPFGQPLELVSRIDALLKNRAYMVLVPGEACADAINREVGALAPAKRVQWLDLLRHAFGATGARPSAKWMSAAKSHLKTVGAKHVAEMLLRWFPLVSAPRTIPLLGAGMFGGTDLSATIHDDNATCLRGLLWMVPEIISPDLIRALGALTLSSYRKIPGVGPRAVKLGNAGVYALGQINDPLAVGQLALLKVKVKFGTAQKEIEKAFTLAAERAGLPREELEEMSIPTYGLTGVGIGEEQLGDFTARLTVTGTDSTELVWIKADGKLQRSIPAEVKASHADDLKELQAAAKDIQKMLPAQRDRIDGLFLQQRTWPLEIWRERYLEHPLVGTLARRLLWEFTEKARTTTGIWFDGRLVDIDLQPLKFQGAHVTVRLWHPIGKSLEEIIGWRNWLDTQQIQQPFKQAHREIYLLTDAELRTRTYSNRFAAHVLKQHQFNALCALRGWKNQLRLLVDADYAPPTLWLPQHGLRAEYWIEGIGTDYGSDTNESGVFLRLSTDQVRFYRLDAAQRSAHAGGGGYQPQRHLDAEPMAVDEIPPLVFSEVMRDVDLFVGVASIGNDPSWSDGGANGRYGDYWQNVSFGDLNASATTRKEVLQRLVPKLKIASLCRFEEKFLVVKGSLRTYKIHLGSGNILMEPNDQYLCIVPKQGQTEDSPVLLPFEGDRTLSVIISKAFLLANDTKITDSTIISQLKHK